MDKDGIIQLKKTFALSPSLVLAKVVFEQLNHQIDESLEWAVDCVEKLNHQDRLSLAKTLVENQNQSAALKLLDELDITHVPLWVKLNCENQNYSIIQSRLDDLQHEGIEIEALQKTLNQYQGKDHSQDEKVKLKVVEKANFAEVVDLAEYQQKSTDFNDVVGLESIKKQINKKIILPFQKPSLFQRFKKKIGGGVLLYGPPGCGKTLLARATAGECNAAFYNVEISDILDMYIGESEQKLHAIFEKARSETPSVLFFDEFEALAGKRENHRNSSSSNLVSQFLTELDGFTQNNSGVLILASTNVPWSIDSAFLRPGRFDRMFFVPPPDKTAREGILKHHMKERPADKDINYAALAAKAKAYSGADLYNLVEMAADEAIDDSIVQEKDVFINQLHFKQALDTSNSTTIEWLTTARNYARYANDGGRYNEVLKFLNKHGK